MKRLITPASESKTFICSLKNQKEFDRVNKNGIKIHTPYYLIVKSLKFSIPLKQPAKITGVVGETSAKNETALNTIFFGMKVGRKMGNAVVRNKIKRRIRHLVKIVSEKSPIKGDKLGIIVIPKKGFHKIMFNELLSEFHRIYAPNI